MSEAEAEQCSSSMRITSAKSVRSAIARCMLGDAVTPVSIGSITLYQHQASAVARVNRALREFGGVLLCDAVGLGKTYTALAVARSHSEPLIIAPAVLRAMWNHATECTGVRASFISCEALSRGATIQIAHSLVIVDEAHHFRNPATRRYAELARLCIAANVLLMSATPIHNSRSDIASLAALFMGHRAHVLDPRALSRVVVRRTEAPRQPSAAMPLVEHAAWRVILNDDAILDQIVALPPPVPPSDGGRAAALVTQGLVRQWVSSSAALLGALKRRIARSHALIATLDAGRYPTRAELSAWVFVDDALQLAFPELLPPSDFIAPELRSAVAEHLEGLRFLARHVSTSASDVESRAGFLREVLHSHGQEKVVAFTSYRETAAALYRALAPLGGVALMTSSGGRIAGGTLTRREILERFAPDACAAARPAPCNNIRILIATDLLSEGVNLQDASAVVHLDLPWTAARMQQRTGRVARLGSRHAAVTEYTLRPSARAEALLGAVHTIERKGGVASSVLGPDVGLSSQLQSSAGDSVALAESIREVLEQWRCRDDGCDERDPAVDDRADAGRADVPRGVLVAAESQRSDGAVAACVVDGRPTLLVVSDTLDVSADASRVSAALGLPSGSDLQASAVRFRKVARALTLWYEAERAAADAGIDSTTVGGRADGRMRAAIRLVDSATSARAFGERAKCAMKSSLLRRCASTAMPVAVEQLVYSGSRTGTQQLREPPGLPADGQPGAAEDGFSLVAVLLFRACGENVE